MGKKPQNVSASVEEQSASVEEGNASTSDLSAMAARLQELVGQFQLVSEAFELPSEMQVVRGKARKAACSLNRKWFQRDRRYLSRWEKIVLNRLRWSSGDKRL